MNSKMKLNVEVEVEVADERMMIIYTFEYPGPATLGIVRMWNVYMYTVVYYPAQAKRTLIYLIILSSALHMNINNSPSQSFCAFVIFTLESKNVVIRQNLILRSFYDLSFAVAYAVNLL